MRIVDSNEERAPMETCLKVAFATDDLQQVNQHFGSAKSFAIYTVDRNGCDLIEVAEFGKLEQDGNEDKLAAKIELLNGCAAVYCEAMGASAIRQVMAAGIQPVKVCRGSPITQLLEDLQNELRTGPPAWVAKAVARQAMPDPVKFAHLEAEGWNE
jgi:nitrogen fixation protein NifX